MTKRLKDKRDGSLWAWTASLASRPEFEEVDVFIDSDKVLPKPAPSAGKEGPLFMHTSAMGVGDAICAVYAACGYAKAGYKVVLRTRHGAWLQGVHSERLEIRPHRETDVNINQDYGLQLKASNEVASRATWYCKNISEFLQIPQQSPARPDKVDKPERVIEGNYVVLCPGSAARDREWRPAHWARLATQLKNKVIVVCSPEERERQTKLFDGTNAEIRSGTPLEAMSIIAHASHVYGNDSGMTHLAGLYGVPATAVMAHLSPAFVFAEAPTVRGATPEPNVDCRFCGWQPDRGFRPACRTECSALSEIKVADVIERPVLHLPKKDANEGIKRQARRREAELSGTRVPGLQQADQSS